MTTRTVVRSLAAAAFASAVAAAWAPAAGAFARNIIPADGATVVRIAKLRTETNRWRGVMGLRPLDYAHDHRELATSGDAFRRWVLDLWHRRAHAAERRAQRPPHLRAWRCIHRYERDPRQGWATNTGNGYYGGLQMDISFQRRYGARLLRTKGTADRWSPLEQIWVAVRAYRSGRGFHPWPNTARMCGLL